MLDRVRRFIVLFAFSTAAVADPLAATYAFRASMAGEERTAEFVLVRTDTAVEVQDKTSGIVERWERDPTGRIFYSRIFLAAGKIIDFQPADFTFAGVSDQWETIRSVLPATSLEALRPSGAGRALGAKTASYRGKVDGATVKVEWLPADGIPARVQRSGSDVGTVLQLTRLERDDVALSLVTSRAQLEAFERIDFADLGDREGDEVIERLLSRSGLELHHH